MFLESGILHYICKEDVYFFSCISVYIVIVISLTFASHNAGGHILGERLRSK